MMKTKFFKGISAAFALVMVALATTFTACEKEEFNVDVKPANAQATISPIVLFVDAQGNVSDVTAQATITANKLVFEGNPDLKITQPVTVTASYLDFQASIQVTIPYLKAGQFANITPTITFKAKDAVISETVTTGAEEPEKGKVNSVDNVTDYYWLTDRTYTKKQGVLAKQEDIVFAADASAEDKMYIRNYFSTIQNTYKETTETVDFKVYPHSRTNLQLVYGVSTIEVKFTKGEVASRAAAKEVGTITYRNYVTSIVDVQELQAIPGHGHAPVHGHGHGHGHGDGNAGGGIVWAD